MPRVLSALVGLVAVAAAGASPKLMARVETGLAPCGADAAFGSVAAVEGALWVGSGRDATAIARVDPVSGKVERVPVGEKAPGWFVVGARGLWIQANERHVLHVDPATRRVVARLELGRTLSQGAAAPDGTIWMPDKEQSIVYRIDPGTHKVVDSFAAGHGAYVALRAFGSMWVASYAGSDVWRFRAR
jgi:streptogramin lyase